MLFIPFCLRRPGFIPVSFLVPQLFAPLGLKEQVHPLWANGMAFSESRHQFTSTAPISLEAPPHNPYPQPTFIA